MNLLLVSTAIVIVLGIAGSIIVFLWLRDGYMVRQLPGRWEAVTNQGRGTEMKQAGPVKITVLFDWLAGDSRFIGDAGISYLIESGGRKILVDLGDSFGKSKPDPLLHNMQQMGWEPDELAAQLEAVVITHHHRDHVGGFRPQMKNSFRMPGGIKPDCPIYLPKPLKHPDLEGQVLEKPEELLPGVLLTGPLPGWMFTLGHTPEQMLVINLEEGLLLVVGDGHPGVFAMARYAREITGRPLYAYFGGTQALLDRSRSLRHRLIGAKNPYWRPVTPEDIGTMAVGLSDLGVKKMFLSTHNADDGAVSIMETVYGKDLTQLRVGETYEF